MSKKKIVSLSQYRKRISRTDKDSDTPNTDNLSFEKKLQDFIHRPFADPGSKKDLIAIFEEEQLKKDRDE